MRGAGAGAVGAAPGTPHPTAAAFGASARALADIKADDRHNFIGLYEVMVTVYNKRVPRVRGALLCRLECEVRVTLFPPDLYFAS